MDSKKVLIGSNPRSANNFLRFCLTESSDLDVYERHPPFERYMQIPYLVSIARNPKDTIVSSAVLRILLTKVEDYKEILNVEIFRNKNGYEILLKEHSPDWIKFEDLSNVNTITQYIANKNNAKWVALENPEKLYDQFKKENSHMLKYKSSKESDIYEKIWDMIEDYDLSECNDLYYEAISKCIKL